MRRVFIVSPFGGKEYNREMALWLCQMAINEHGVAPFAAHLLYPQFLNEDTPGQRDLGILAGMSWQNVCDEVWVYADRGITEGMKQEIAQAKKRKKPILEIDIQGKLSNYVEGEY